MAKKKFGGQFKKTGQFGAKRQAEIDRYGGIEQFKADTGLGADSSKKDISTRFKSWMEEQKSGGSPFGEDAPTITDPGAETTTNVPQITEQATNVGQQGATLTDTGAELAGQGAIAQSQLLPQVQQNIGQSEGIRNAFMSSMFGNQAIAYDPSQMLQQQQQQFFDPIAAQRMADVNQFFGAGSRAQESLARDLANTVTDFDELGVSGTSEAAALGDVMGDFATARARAQLETGEQNRQDLINERNRISGLGGEFAGQGLQGTTGFQQAVNQLLGVGGDIGQGISQTGLGLAGTGVNASDVANRGLLGAGELDLAGRNQEMDRQQAEQVLRQNFIQNFIENLRNNEQFKRGNRIQGDLLELLGL